MIATIYHPDYTRVAVVGYGNDGREQFLTHLSNINLCDLNTSDDSRKCGLASTAAIDELFNYGNAFAAAVIVHIQNGPCGDDPCT